MLASLASAHTEGAGSGAHAVLRAPVLCRETWLGGWENVDPERLAAHRDSLPEHEINMRDGKHESASANGLSWTCRHVGGDEVFLDMLARPCFAAAEQLCGEGTLIYPEGKTQPGANFAHPGANFRGVGSAGQAGRGVYAKMPPRLSDEERAAAMDEPITGGHVDGWDGDRWRVSVNTTLDDVEPGGGAFSVWPGSHLLTYPHRHWTYDWDDDTAPTGDMSTGVKRISNPDFDAAVAKAKEEIEPVELCGPAGSVIFWCGAHTPLATHAPPAPASGAAHLAHLRLHHEVRSPLIIGSCMRRHHRLMHSGSRNRGTSIRSGVIFEYYKKPVPGLDNSPKAEVMRGNAPDMWGDWSEEVRAVPLQPSARL